MTNRFVCPDCDKDTLIEDGPCAECVDAKEGNQ